MGRPLPAPLVFMGTPDFAAVSLKALLDAGVRPAAVYTRPDKSAGRGHHLSEPPVKQLAKEAGLPVLQPKTLRTPEAAAELRAFAPEVVAVVAYGQLLPQELLDIPSLGCVNVHASLLPRHRGASPIAHSIWAGDSKTGVCTMRMEAGMDTGPVYLREEMAAPPDATTGSLTPLLAAMGAGLLVRTLQGLKAGGLRPAPQDDAFATLAPRLKKGQGRLDFTRPASELERQARAFDPWPGTFFSLRGETLKVLSAALGGDAPKGAAPGEVVLSDESLAIACGDGRLFTVRTLQREGKRPLPALEVLRGFPIPPGTRL